MDLSILPGLNAGLNALATVALVAGYLLIRNGRWRLHRNAMITALGLSTLFLCSYLFYHYQVGSVRFQGRGPVRVVYFTILITHTVLAATVPILAGIAVYQALRRRFPRHKAVARWAFPIWLYVSVTGVIIYWMLYRLDL
ncbi:MAG: DUF420 domain-containing protein [Thermoanaerobaculia bacterium]|nr:DUF420 domain-containing protein [Thermoanaerobaculia bacterium]